MCVCVGGGDTKTNSCHPLSLLILLGFTDDIGGLCLLVASGRAVKGTCCQGDVLAREYVVKERCCQGSMSQGDVVKMCCQGTGYVAKEASRRFVVKGACFQGDVLSRGHVVKEMCCQGA